MTENQTMSLARSRAFTALLAALALVALASPARAAAPAGRYTTTIDAVTDTKTGLVWQRAVPNATFTWQSALAYCQNLRLGGAGGYRLPTVKELATLVDETASAAPAIDATAFPSTAAAFFWSSTPLVDAPGKAWGVHFQKGNATTTTTPTTSRLRCVKSP
jgi:hypothetical protein